jgi:hypothetical protein
MTDKLALMGSMFQHLWRVDETPLFGRLLKVIDDAIWQHRCHTRIVRLHRMLERRYS